MGKHKWDMEAVKNIAGRGLKIVYADDEIRKAFQRPESESRINKYSNKKTAVDGITFDSKAESQRYGELKMMERHGLIKGFEMQVPYSIDVNGYHICKYIADFVVTWPDGLITVEDVKGVETRDFRLKMKLMKAVHNIDITLISKNNINGSIKKNRKSRSDHAGSR
jgi:hypothetical protein